MSVYVDELKEYKFGDWRDGFWCHMVADTIEELDEMAVKLELNLRWMQRSSSGIIHYDLRKRKRAQAVKLGAIECDGAKMLEVGKAMKLVNEWRIPKPEEIDNKVWDEMQKEYEKMRDERLKRWFEDGLDDLIKKIPPPRKDFGHGNPDGD